MRGKPFSISFLLVALRCEVANQSFVATATARAEKVINHFTPSLRLDNTPITLTDPVFSGPRGNATYLGRTKAGRGVIALEVEQDPFRNIETLGFDDIVAVVSAVHELVHLKHDELASSKGEGNTFGAIQELGIGDLDVEKHSVTTIDIVVNKLGVSQKTTEKLARHETQKTLYPWIVEGVAVQLEIFLLNELRKMAKKSDRGTADKIQEYINGRFSDLRERNETEMRSYYQGLKMIRLLTKHFSAEEMVSILKDINMEEADKLYAYSPLGMIIQRDPRFLPGLADENVAVRNSLKQSGILPLDLNDVPVNESMSTALASESSVANLTSIALEIGGRIHQLTLKPHDSTKDRVSYESAIDGSRCIITIPLVVGGDLSLATQLKKEHELSKLLNSSGIPCRKYEYLVDASFGNSTYPVFLEVHKNDYHHVVVSGEEGQLNVERHLRLEDGKELSQKEFIDNLSQLTQQLYDLLNLGFDVPDEAWTLRTRNGRLDVFIHNINGLTQKSFGQDELFSLLFLKVKRAWMLFTTSLSEEDREANKHWCKPNVVLQMISELCEEKRNLSIFLDSFDDSIV